eukprot:365463-Chlamydomonas_euryale.AAC.2
MPAGLTPSPWEGVERGAEEGQGSEGGRRKGGRGEGEVQRGAERKGGQRGGEVQRAAGRKGGRGEGEVQRGAGSKERRRRVEGAGGRGKSKQGDVIRGIAGGGAGLPEPDPSSLAPPAALPPFCSRPFGRRGGGPQTARAIGEAPGSAAAADVADAAPAPLQPAARCAHQGRGSWHQERGRRNAGEGGGSNASAHIHTCKMAAQV